MKSNWKITINGRTYRTNRIPELKRKNTHYSSKLKCHYISLKIHYKGMAMRGYWIRMKGRQNWNLLVSANDKLSFIKIREYYKNRWSIEVFFKDCKQNLWRATNLLGRPCCHHKYRVYELQDFGLEKEISGL